MRHSFSWLLAFFVLTAAVSAQCEVATFTGPPGTNFGSSVEVSGDWVFAGAPRVSVGPISTVQVFHRSGSTWVFDQALESTVPANGSFGNELAADGDWLFVYGRINSATGTHVQVYRLMGTTWTPTQVITASFPAFQVRDIAIEGDSAVVVWCTGSTISDYGDIANVYERSGSTWSESAVLVPFGAGDPRNFGVTAAITGDWVGIGASRYSESGLPPNVGGVYLFERASTGWEPHSVLAVDGAEQSDAYGASLAASDGRFAVGSQSLVGTVQMFAWNGSMWNREAAIAPDIEAYFPYSNLGVRLLDFGFAIDLDGDRLVGTAPDFFGRVSRAGAAWLFERDSSGWHQRGRFFKEAGFAGDEFGMDIALSGDTIVTTADTSTDAVMVHDIAMGQNFRYCEAAPNSVFPEGAQIGWEGSLSVATNEFQVRISRTPATFGLFFYGTSATQTPFGDGFLCVASPLVRLSGALSFNGLSPTLIDLDLSQFPNNGSTISITPGDTLYFQSWFRDTVGGGSGFNASNGLSVQFCP
jgi:hypothetical protein